MLLFSAQLVAIVSVLLLAIGYVKTNLKERSARLFLLLSLGVVCYLVRGMAMPYVDPGFRISPGAWGVVLNLGSNAIPGVFMLYCYAVFQDDRHVPRLLMALLVLELLLDHLNYRSLRPSVFLSVQADSSLSQFLLGPVPDFMQLFFATSAVYWTARGWSADLVESRRLMRWVIVGLQGVLILSVVFLENYLLSSASVRYAQMQAIIVYAIALLTFLMLSALLHIDAVGFQRVMRKVAPFVPPEHADDILQADARRFQEVFEGSRAYREHGLTIADLAAKMQLPEYRLRALINKHLGYRNFNALLHEYRLRDASAMLADPAQRHLPVLTIALSVGYQSITPFNNAFRQAQGVTPTEFRRRAMQPPSQAG
ncbi:MAG: helix-turn-helix transcriptional regulator [Pseudomonadales bacterium]|nr:helix-turn-helix transcriptional regulator [Pseudomonadales bacterium]MCP5330382.1 helix-turn-helix transcriptional regulator [Pseudomonadales bacterium]MCP5344005.1 helix-turn-helix transcriptional regulator [Pseudomonadales bacterium]